MNPRVLGLCVLAALGCRPPPEPQTVEPTTAVVADDTIRMEVLAWADSEAKRWYASKADGDEAACRAQWVEVADAIAREADPERRAWMMTAQFLIGRSDPGEALSRADVAEAVIAELGLDDRHWSVSPYALATAAWETGRWTELGSELIARIATQQPEVGAYLALELYMEATGDGEWDRSEAVWSAWVARPELATTQIGPIMHSYGPERRLAPGNFIPETCVEKLQGGPLCTAEINQFVVIELWSTTCEGCINGVPVLRDAQAALRIAYPDDPPLFVSIDPYEDPEPILEFQRTTPMPWTNAWIPEAEREAFAAAFELQSIPVLLLVGPDGRILDSSPSLRAENVEARVHHFRSR